MEKGLSPIGLAYHISVEVPVIIRFVQHQFPLLLEVGKIGGGIVIPRLRIDNLQLSYRCSHGETEFRHLCVGYNLLFCLLPLLFHESVEFHLLLDGLCHLIQVLINHGILFPLALKHFLILDQLLHQTDGI